MARHPLIGVAYGANSTLGTNGTAPYQAHALWFETLLSGDTAQVYICPNQHAVSEVMHWNGKTCGAMPRETETQRCFRFRCLRSRTDAVSDESDEQSLARACRPMPVVPCPS